MRIRTKNGELLPRKAGGWGNEHMYTTVIVLLMYGWGYAVRTAAGQYKYGRALVKCDAQMLRQLIQEWKQVRNMPEGMGGPGTTHPGARQQTSSHALLNHGLVVHMMLVRAGST